MSSKRQLELEIEGLKKDLARLQANRDSIYRAGDASIKELQAHIHDLNNEIAALEGLVADRERELQQLADVLDNITRPAEDFVIPPTTNGKKPK